MKRTSPGAFSEPGAKTELPVNLSLGPDETIVGWYQNPVPWQESLVIFTSDAFYVADEDRTERIALADIVGYEDPTSKADVTGVRVLTKNGSQFVRVAGSFGPAGNRKDAYSFIMVVRALCPSEPVVTFDQDPLKSK
jgi:hypothetical protein